MNIGTIDLTVGGKTKRSNNGQHTVTIDWENLPDESRTFIVRYGLKQYLADGAAGAANHDELVSGVTARMEKLAKADFARTRGDGPAKPDTEERITLRLLKEAIRAAAKAQNVTLPKEKVEEAAKALAANAEHPRTVEAVKEAKRQMAAKAKMTDSAADADTILAELGLTE